MEDSNSQHASRHASPPTASRHAQAHAASPPISALAVPSRWEREWRPRLRRGAGAGSAGAGAKMAERGYSFSLTTFRYRGTSCCGPGGQRRAGCRTTGRTARSLRGAACRRRRARTEGALCTVIGPASVGGQRGLDLDKSDGRGESGGVQAPEGDTQLPRGFLKGSGGCGESPGFHLVSVADLGPQGGRRLCLLVAVRQSRCRTKLRSVSTLVVPYSECLV